MKTSAATVGAAFPAVHVNSPADLLCCGGEGKCCGSPERQGPVGGRMNDILNETKHLFFVLNKFEIVELNERKFNK